MILAPQMGGALPRAYVLASKGNAMRRKMETRVEAINRANAASEEANHYARALDAILADRVDATREVVIDVRSVYLLKLVGATECDGGRIIVTYRYPGQRDSSRVYLLDTYRRELRERIEIGLRGYEPMLAAAEHLAGCRDRLADAAVAAKRAASGA